LPDLAELADRLGHVLHGLNGIPSAVVEQMMFAGLGPRDAHAAIRWAGGQLTEHLNSLRSI
jgi:hypothetical protein